MLKLAPDLQLPIEVAGQAIALVGIRGSGKTNTAGVIVDACTCGRPTMDTRRRDTSEPRRGDRVMTPAWVAQDMVAHFKPAGVVLEPFRGSGVFSDLLPAAHWCEIDEGKDFFDWHAPVDFIMSNPPYSKTRAVFRHSYTLASEFVYLVPLRNVFSGFGFVREIHRYGGMPEIRIYGTGGKLGFPMGNCIGAIHCRRGYTGQTRWSYYE